MSSDPTTTDLAREIRVELDATGCQEWCSYWVDGRPKPTECDCALGAAVRALQAVMAECDRLDRMDAPGWRVVTRNFRRAIHAELIGGGS